MDDADYSTERSEFAIKMEINRLRFTDSISEKRCLSCGDKIPKARRKAVPGCKLCVSCKEEEERNL